MSATSQTIEHLLTVFDILYIALTLPQYLSRASNLHSSHLLRRRSCQVTFTFWMPVLIHVDFAPKLDPTRLLQCWMLSCGKEGLWQNPGVTMFPFLLLHFWSGSKPACVGLFARKSNQLQDALKQVSDSVLLKVLPAMGFSFVCSFCHRVNGCLTTLSLCQNRNKQ